MRKTQLPAEARASFEALKQTNEHGAEYWSARNLQPLLGYSQWRRFEQAIDRAKASCATSGNNPEHHFAGAGKPITGSKVAVQVVNDRRTCDSSGNDCASQFAGAGKMVGLIALVARS